MYHSPAPHCRARTRAHQCQLRRLALPNVYSTEPEPTDSAGSEMVWTACGCEWTGTSDDFMNPKKGAVLFSSDFQGMSNKTSAEEEP